MPEHFDRYASIKDYPGLEAPREVVAVTGALLCARAGDFQNLGGFDEVYEEEAQDVDLCLRMRMAGLSSVMHPALLSYHYENSTRTAKASPNDREEFLRRFADWFDESIYEWQMQSGLAQQS